MRRRGARRAGRTAGRRAARRTSRRMRRRFRRRMLVGGMVLLAGGAVAYKLTQKDADRIEQHTGQSVEELSDEEMQAAMKELNIQSQPLEEDDRAAMAGAQPVAAGGEEVEDDEDEGEGEGMDYLVELEQLAALHDKGILTDAEFEAKKKQLLGL